MDDNTLGLLILSLFVSGIVCLMFRVAKEERRPAAMVQYRFLRSTSSAHDERIRVALGAHLVKRVRITRADIERRFHDDKDAHHGDEATIALTRAYIEALAALLVERKIVAASDRSYLAAKACEGRRRSRELPFIDTRYIE